MRKSLCFILFFIVCSFRLPAQNEEHIFQKVETDANTNPRSWAAHVKKYTELPDSVSNSIPHGVYTVTVQFVIDVHGNIGQVKAVNDPGYGLAKRAEKMVLSYTGKWQSAIQCGRIVRSYKQLLIVFTVAAQ